jgi:hypothetical protein
MQIQKISLVGLIAIITCVALGISHTLTSLRLLRANIELLALRKRLEMIPVNDPDQIAARRLPSSDNHVRRWAIRVPPNVAKTLYANWGESALTNIQNTDSKSAHKFQLKPDPATNESLISLRVERNGADPARGTLKIESGENVSIIAIDSKTTSLLMGEIPCRSEAVGDNAVVRSAGSPVILFATEATENNSASFSLWLE